MKWSDLTLKERKQIYDAVRAENPNASYFDIKSQFDLIPEYEDGGKKIMPPKELGLTPGTSEYYKRQQQISGKAELVQPEAYVTPVGYVKDAITTAEELEKGNYGNAAISVLMNAIPWGVGKSLKKIKSKVSNTLNTPIEIHSSMVDEYPSILAEKARSKTSKNKKKVKEESDYDSEFSEVIRRDRNIKKYEKEINKTIEDAVLPDKKTYELVKGIDTAYGTDIFNSGRVPTNLSVDRIDSNKIYTKNNVQLVCMAVNQMKSDLNDLTFYKFCEAIVANAAKWNKGKKKK